MTTRRTTQVDPAKMQYLTGEVRGQFVCIVTFRLPGQRRVVEYVADREEAKQIYRDAVEASGPLNFPAQEGVA